MHHRRRLDPIWRAIGFATVASIFPLLCLFVTSNSVIRWTAEIEAICLVAIASFNLATSVAGDIDNYLGDETAGITACLILLVVVTGIGVGIVHKVSPVFPNYHPGAFVAASAIAALFGILLATPVSDWRNQRYMQRARSRRVSPTTHRSVQGGVPSTP